MRMFLVVGCVALAAAAASCEATGPLFREVTPEGDSAVIYVYRLAEVAEHGSRYDVTIDGASIGGVSGVQQWGYLYRKVGPGAHRVTSTSDRGSYSLVIDAKPGESYYVEVSQLSAELGVRPILRTPEIGRSAIADTRYSGT